MNPSFNLIDQPWIPCVTHEGELAELSLRDLFQAAPRLRAIHCETPLMNASIMPVLLAILHRVFGPGNVRQWEQLWTEGHFSSDALDAYFEQWYERFDLFHPRRPFYQTRDSRCQNKSILDLAVVQSEGDILFNHQTPDTKPYFTPNEAARALLVAHYFRSGGGRSGDKTPYFVDSIFKSGVIFFAQGKNLFETLMFNLMPYPSESFSGFRQLPDDKPVWEKDEPGHPQIAQMHVLPPKGYLDYLTWETNHIWLFPEQMEHATVVREIQIVPAAKPIETLLSPQKRYIRKSKEGETSWSFLYFNKERALWRDYYSLLPNDSTDGIRPPLVVLWLARLNLGHDYPLRLQAVGMSSNQAKINFYRQEELPLPPELLDGSHQLVVAEAINNADVTAEKLRSAVNILADNVLMRGGSGKPDSSNRTNLTKQWDSLSLYWAELEPHFWTFVTGLVAGNPAAEDQWSSALVRSARTALSQSEKMAGDSPWALKGGVAARWYLNTELKKLFQPQ
ncbi:type I-E CRISPR-associated protein Cse1/CasA [Anaerolineae bacterium CFX9]|nr:type I-E CRISPR-associated protein Cse1/CasA [Anaerolineae bacterium CFX9]